ncbi:hypothetical protein [Campylobacter fetus]|uniref:hypothetical protein n=1 Tax=Campylobacter fetus TaxID=196 RepID=UPI000818ADC8|nr:hypothetical protein [Campylobacter fetus]OCS03193.1 hypothetical protein AC237_08120 [Campylobacter fetus subsp. testudinum]
MKELFFEVKFLSDIVLPATSNTEGNINYLDYIPGSNFLGMVAQNYDKFSDSFDIFYSGNVCFSDAHMVYNDKITYKTPYSFYHQKLNNKAIYNKHMISKEQANELRQLKQLRVGYITEDLEHVLISHSYSQKSSYDTQQRKSKDSTMFGYKSLPKDSIWIFCVKLKNECKDENLIISTLQNSYKLGKSRSAQYGLIKISYLQNYKSNNIKTFNDYENYDFLYANSRLALIDDYGNPTYDLSFICKDIEICYKKTNIRNSSFTPYNGKKARFESERLCVNKGSVIAVKKLTAEQISIIKNGIGAYKSEGFGDIIINPNFLKENKPEIKNTKKDDIKTDTQYGKSLLTEFLKAKRESSDINLKIANDVAKLIDEKRYYFSNVSSSQWGNIRRVCDTSNDENLLENIKNNIKKWGDEQAKQLINITESIKNNQCKFIKLFAMKMRSKNDN